MFFRTCIDLFAFTLTPNKQAVYKGMEHYHTLLTQRFQTSQKISLIEKQNGELKALLRQYMNARVNDELQVPPTHIMLAQAGLQ